MLGASREVFRTAQVLFTDGTGVAQPTAGDGDEYDVTSTIYSTTTHYSLAFVQITKSVIEHSITVETSMPIGLFLEKPIRCAAGEEVIKSQALLEPALESPSRRLATVKNTVSLLELVLESLSRRQVTVTNTMSLPPSTLPLLSTPWSLYKT